MDIGKEEEAIEMPIPLDPAQAPKQEPKLPIAVPEPEKVLWPTA
jgi:hypothetical protein